jgi:hypothetical protein
MTTIKGTEKNIREIVDLIRDQGNNKSNNDRDLYVFGLVDLIQAQVKNEDATEKLIEQEAARISEEFRKLLTLELSNHIIADNIKNIREACTTIKSTLNYRKSTDMHIIKTFCDTVTRELDSEKTVNKAVEDLAQELVISLQKIMSNEG